MNTITPDCNSEANWMAAAAAPPLLMPAKMPSSFASLRVISIGREALLAIPTPEHYWPLLYTLSLKGSRDDISFFNDKAVGGSLMMTSVEMG